MAKLYRADGRVEDVAPADGKKFTLAELQTLVGGNIELAAHYDSSKVLVLNEEGKVHGQKLNQRASYLFKHFPFDYLVGDVVECLIAEIR